jgi:hypothetical protein
LLLAPGGVSHCVFSHRLHRGERPRVQRVGRKRFSTAKPVNPGYEARADRLPEVIVRSVIQDVGAPGGVSHCVCSHRLRRGERPRVQRVGRESRLRSAC